MVYNILVIAGGLFSICGAVFNWNWFFENYRARPIVKLFGREGTRTFYIVIGVILVFAGIAA